MKLSLQEVVVDVAVGEVWEKVQSVQILRVKKERFYLVVMVHVD